MRAAHEAAASQHYPQSALYVVATPIGNLADITLRALHVLQLADCIACEDTRHTQGMLRAYGIDKASAQLLAVHQHNEAEAAQAVLARLQQGERIAYVSDAGTPGVSDPGARLVAAVHAASLKVVAVPGVSSVTAAISVAGAVAATGGNDGGFLFAGFLPTKSGERTAAIEKLSRESRCVVLLEAPHRIDALANNLKALGHRPVTLAREITKQFESIATLPAEAVTAWLAQDANRSRGEFVVVLHPEPQVHTSDALTETLLPPLLAVLPLKTAVRIVADVTGGSKNAIYDTALKMQSRRDADTSA